MTAATLTHPSARARAARRDAARRSTSAYVILMAALAALALIGLVMVLSASSVTALHRQGSSWFYFSRQLIGLVGGIVLFAVAVGIDYHVWRKFAVVLHLGAMAMLFAVLVPGIGVNANGSSRWIDLGPLQLQPSEFAKLTTLLVIADLAAKRQAWVQRPNRVLHPALVWFGIVALLLMKQPNLGTTLVLGVTVFAVLFCAGVPGGALARWASAGFAVAVGLALMADYRRARLLAFLDPWADPESTGYQIIQSQVSLGSGGWFGVGLGEGRQKWGFLPEAHTDFIFAIVGEELGLVGALFVVLLFALLGILGIRAAMQAPDTFGRLLATGVTTWFCTQAFVNLGAVVGILPITGVPLPFISFGSSAMLANMAAAGILCNVCPRQPSVSTPVDAERRNVTDVVVAGGGTAGHVLPGLAIAEALRRRGCSIHYIGAERGLEARLVPPTGIPLTLLPGRGIARRLTLANVGAVLGILRAAWTAVRLVRRLRPRAVVGVGGYTSVPAVLAAAMWHVPIVVAEQNTHPGAANRLAARLAKASAVSFPGTPLPRAVVTGNPIRAEVLAVDRERDGAAARQALGVDARRRLVLVAGGSLGALSINRAVVELAEQWRDRDDVAIRHVVGDRDWDERGGRPHPGYEQVRYEDDMPRALAAADVGVFRSGSSMCFEIAAVGLPSVLVPSPHVTGDHQTGNARLLADAGAAIVVPDDDLTADRLAKELDVLLGDAELRAGMASALRAIAKPDAAERIADLVLGHARSERKQ